MQAKGANKTKKVEEVEMKVENTLVPLEKYLEAGVHIGSKYKTGSMKQFIYKIRKDGLCVLDIGELNKRIKQAAKFISRYAPEKVLVVAGRAYAQKPVQKFSEVVGTKCRISRFIPGTLTNPDNPVFMEPELIITADPPADRQAIKEAIKAKIPVISLCDTSNTFSNIDFIIPTNNKGKKALALIFWLLARETLKASKVIKTDKEFTLKVDDFEAKVEKEKIAEFVEKNKPKGRRK